MPDRFSLAPHEPNALIPAEPIPPAAPPLEEFDDGPDWQRAIAAIRRHLTLVLAITAVGCAATVLVARRIKPVYRATATIWIASQNEAQGRSQLGPIRQDPLLQWESWIDLLKSFAILDPVVRELHLNVSPVSPADTALLRTLQVSAAARGGDYTLDVSREGAYDLSERRHPGLERGTAGDSIGRNLGFLWAPAADSNLLGRRIRFTVVTQRTAAERLADAIHPTVDRNGSFLRLDLEGQSPVRTATIVNAIAQRYVQVASDLKRRRLAEFTRNLEEQRVEAQTNLERAERELEQFRIKHVGMLRAEDIGIGRAGTPADGGVAAGEAANDGASLDGVRRDRRAIAQWLAAPAATRSASGPLLYATGTQSLELRNAVDELARKRADLRTLRYRYEDDYPAVRMLSEDIDTLMQQTLPTIVRQFDSDLAARERDLSSRVAARTDTLRAIPARALEESRLVRSASLASDLFASVQQRYQEARLAMASGLQDVWVLDSAVPAQLPAADHRLRVLLLGCGTSLALALALAVAIDRFDPRVRYPAEVSRQMGLHILGAVPYLRSHRGNGAIAPEAAEEVTEALRGVRVALTHAGSVARPLLLTVSSSGPGDGKSFITSNLGLSFALAGYRTLVIDGDVRRGTLHRAFGGQRRPGLTDCLRGELSVTEVLQRTPFDSLTLIGSGTRTRVAPELLGGPAMQRLLDRVRPDYDVILCDSPPLSAGIDPYVLGTVTGQMLIVMRTGVSVRSVLQAKLAVLSQLPVRLIGAVLNAVPPGNLYRPYSYYVEGYSASDEVVDTAPALPGA